MPSIATEAAPRRAHLLTTLRAGDTYGFLGRAEAYVRANPDDAEVCAAVVRAYAALGLASAADRILRGSTLEQADRETLAASIPRNERRLAWSRLDARFQANLEVFESRTGLAADVERVWRASRVKLQLFETLDGGVQVYSRLSEAPGWLPALAPHHRLASAAAMRNEWNGKIIRPLVVNGLGLGHLARDIIAASSETFLNFSAPVLLIEPSLLAWAVVLHLHDWHELLAEPRVSLHAGPEPLAALEAELGNNERLHACLLCGGAVWPGSFPEQQIAKRLAAFDAECGERQDRRFAEACASVSKRDRAAWARRYEAAGRDEPPLSVIGITSRYTTVLQYTMRDLLAAFERLGHRTHLFIEADDHSHFAPLRLLNEIRQRRPDLIVMLDHLRAEFTNAIPDNIPGICWIQDQLPHLFCAEAGRGVRPLEFVIGHGFPECLTEFGYPPDRFLPCVIPTDAGRLLDPDERPEDLDPYRCDVMYASNVSDTAAEHLAQFQERVDAAGRPFVDAAYETLMQAVRQPSFCGDYDYGALVTRVERETGLAIANAGMRAEIEGTLRSIADRHLREQTVRCAARWAEQTGRCFHLYGRGWERHAELARFARGVVEPGKPLGRAFRAARISLHAGCNGALHQRVLDGLCAGGFFLIARKPSDTAHPLNQAIYRYLRDERPTPPFRLRPADLPEPHAAAYRRFLEVRGSDPQAGVLATREMLLNVQAECEWNCRHSASSIWPRFERVTYHGPDEQVERMEHFLAHDDERRELAEEMRRAVVERFTYDALVRSVLDLMRKNLAGRPRSLLDPPAPVNRPTQTTR